ncbi:MAG: polyprenyl synthetase family protein [Gammaproteobacteria bacterium]
MTGASSSQLAALDAYAHAIGLAFQVHDDVLDVIGDTTTLGKQQGPTRRSPRPPIQPFWVSMPPRPWPAPVRPGPGGIDGFRPAGRTLRALACVISCRGSTETPDRPFQLLAPMVSKRCDSGGLHL